MDGTSGPSRRRFLGMVSTVAASGALGWVASACGTATGPDVSDDPTAGVLKTRWRAPSTTLEAGVHPLGFGSARDGYVRIPIEYDPEVPAPLALLLHGAGGNAQEWAGAFPVFDRLGMVVLAVDSRRRTWDLTYGDFGSDVPFIDEALARAFDMCNVDAGRIAISGFSDGASYALSLGLTNGNFFTHVLAFSPGFIDTAERRGKPPVFLAHGKVDMVLPVSLSRRLSQRLSNEGYEVTYQEFAGGHELLPEVGEAGYGWFGQSTSPC